MYTFSSLRRSQDEIRDLESIFGKKVNFMKFWTQRGESC